MLGAVANHAWAEDSIYLARSGIKDIRMDLESKTIPSSVFRVTELNNLGWTPMVANWRDEEEKEASVSYHNTGGGSTPRRRSKTQAKIDPVMELLQEAPTGLSTAQLADSLHVSRSTVHKRMTRLFEQERVNYEKLASGSNLWKAK